MHLNYYNNLNLILQEAYTEEVLDDGANYIESTVTYSRLKDLTG